MNRWLACVLVLGLLVLALVPARTSFAAPADEKLEQEVLALRRQIHELRKQIIDKYVAAGKLTPEEAAKHKQGLDERFESQVKHGFDKKHPCKEWKEKSKGPKPKLRHTPEEPAR